MWAKVVLAILNFAISLTEYLSSERLIKAGEDAILVKGLEEANARIAAAISARRAISDGLPESDPYRRD